MIVFSNTTPFIALSSVQRLDLLPRLFQRIYVVEDDDHVFAPKIC
jgi:hypothetical protein